MPDSDESRMKIESDLHGDMQKPAEMSGSHSALLWSNNSERNSLSGKFRPARMA